MFSSNSDEWCTPINLFNKLNNIYNFDIDLCSDHKNHLCSEYYTKVNSCFNLHCHGKSIFCNPPYGRKIGLFIKKCYKLYNEGNDIVMLLPARTDTKWFHDYIYNKCEIIFLKGRLKFSNSKNSAPFPSMICIYSYKEVALCINILES